MKKANNNIMREKQNLKMISQSKRIIASQKHYPLTVMNVSMPLVTTAIMTKTMSGYSKMITMPSQSGGAS